MISSQEIVERFKIGDQSFTRKRKQTFCSTVLLMCNMLRKSLAIEIDTFWNHLSNKIGLDKESIFTKSAFVQRRKKVNPDVFSYLSSVIIEDYYGPDNTTLNRWLDFRVLAVDGSILTLPFTKELKTYYRSASSPAPEDVVQARSSVLYDVLNGFVLDAALENLSHNERSLAMRHKSQWRSKDLIIYDRGYGSYDFINEHVSHGVDCLIRLRKTHSSVVKQFVKSGKKSLVTGLYPGKSRSLEGKNYTKNNPIQIRLLRIDLPTGEPEILITTLLDSQKYPTSAFKKLYFLRWKVETFYGALKNKLKVEHFSGYSQTSILQDFFCAIFISNIQAMIVYDLREELQLKNENKKHEYKVNVNLSYGFLKNRVLELLCKEAPLEEVYQELQALFLKNTVPIRNNRTNERKTSKYACKIKVKVPKNHKDAI